VPDKNLLRIAVPNKGSLSQSAADMLREAGYRSAATPRSSR
jgi:ATP phosphoribosyltransferase